MDTKYEQTSLLKEQNVGAQRPIECLGLTFDSDEARRAHFMEILREKLRDPEFRKIEGFPIGDDEDILALSDPPYYTACPNPFIDDFIRYYGKPYDPDIPYAREPFAADVSEGKNDPIYNAHSYHTKVPHKAIMRYIGPCPHLGNHLRVFKCEMIDVLLGKLSGCLTPNARMIPLRVVIRNRPAD